MNKLIFFVILNCVIFINSSILYGSSLNDGVSIREKTKINLDWKFKLGDIPEAANAEFNNRDWKKVQVPHDWSIEGKFDTKNPSGSMGAFLPGGIAWYRKYLNIEKLAENKQVYIEFEGVYMNSDVYINGHHLGHHSYGYTGFYYNLTPFLNPNGKNVMAVRVDNSCLPQDRWYSGAGIYRNVWLHTTGNLHVDMWGTYITTPYVHKSSSTVHIKTFLLNHLKNDCQLVLKTEILDKENNVVATANSKSSVEKEGSQTVDQEIVVPTPHLWEIENPYLYTARTTILENGKVVDNYATPFGIREIMFNDQQGFVLNGKKVILKGVCIHQHSAGLGTALHEKTIERHLLALKDMGCNAIRLSHYPHAPGLYDMADRLGILLIAEAFDNWRGYKSDNGNKFTSFEDTWKEDMKRFIDLDRNHPSIILWSVGNEVQVNVKDFSECMRILKKLVDFVHQYEPSRAVTSAIAPGSRKVNNLEPDSMAYGSDVAGFNYQAQLYEKDREKHPELVIVGTETKPYYERNFLKKSGDNLVFGGAEEATNPYFFITPGIAGQFIWSGIDYLGESAGWPLKGWPHGLIDLCGYRKPYSWFTQSLYSDKPMVHIAIRDKSDSIVGQPSWSWPPVASHWNWKIGEVLDVYTYTNEEEVELFVNEKSVGTSRLADFPDKTIKWQVPYQPGTIKAVALKNSKQTATHGLKTAGTPAKIVLESSVKSMKADGEDILYVEVTVTDNEGVIIPVATNQVNFNVKGPASITGVGNGNLFSDESFKGSSIKCYKGKCIVILRSALQEGEITLEVSSKGLKSGNMKLNTIK